MSKVFLTIVLLDNFCTTIKITSHASHAKQLIVIAWTLKGKVVKHWPDRERVFNLAIFLYVEHMSPRRKKTSTVKTKPLSLVSLIEFCRFIASFASLDLTDCSPFNLCHIEHHKSQKIDKNVFISSLSTSFPPFPTIRVAIRV